VNKDDEGVVTITPRKDLDDGVYTIEIKKVEDTASNVMDDFSEEFTLDDETAPKILEDEAYLEVVDFKDNEYEITILFDEEMAIEGKYSVLDLANYTIEIDGTDRTLEWVDDQDDYSVEIEAIDGNETVVITIEGLALADSDNGTPPVYTVNTDYTTALTVGRVADKAGNYTGLSNDVTLKMKSDVSITIQLDSAKAIDKKTVEVKFKSNLQNPEIQDFTIVSQDGEDKFDIESLDIIDADEIILNLEDELPADVLGTVDGAPLRVVVNGNPESENNSGIGLRPNDFANIADEIALSVLEEDDVNTNRIYRYSGDDDEVQAVYAEYNRNGIPVKPSDDIDGVSKIYIVFDEAIAPFMAGSTGLFKVNGGDNYVSDVKLSSSSVIELTVDGEVVKGDSIDITAIYDKVGNSAKNLALNIEYLVKDVVALADEATVATAKGNLVLSVTGATNPTATITLPATQDGADVEWEASAGSIVTVTYTTPARTDDAQTITLTATITKGAASDTQTFTLTIPAGSTGSDEITIDKD